MDERSALVNGRFLHQLDPWAAAGGASYHAGDGDSHYGVAVLPIGASVTQDFAVNRARGYTLELAVKPVGAALSGSQATIAITDGDGNAVVTQALIGDADLWTVNRLTVGLASGTTYRLAIANASFAGNVRVDDVWLWWVPASRAVLARQVHTRLDDLAVDADLTTAPLLGQSEGSYTDAVDAGLRAIGAIDPETDLPDVRFLEAASLDRAILAIERAMLERLQRRYAVLTDLRVGERDEKLSQIGAALARLTSTAAGSASRRVGQRTLTHVARDYSLGDVE